MKIKKKLAIDETSYHINNLSFETDFIILTNLKTKINNLPITLKNLWITANIDIDLIVIPFDCKINYF